MAFLEPQRFWCSVGPLQTHGWLIDEPAIREVDCHVSLIGLHHSHEQQNRTISSMILKSPISGHPLPSHPKNMTPPGIFAHLKRHQIINPPKLGKDSLPIFQRIYWTDEFQETDGSLLVKVGTRSFFPGPRQ